MATDPVCKMAVDPQHAAARVEYRGVTYYFCSEQCHKAFVAHPEQYQVKDPGGGHPQHHGR